STRRLHRVDMLGEFVLLACLALPLARGQNAPASASSTVSPPREGVVTLEAVTVFGETQATSIDRKKNADTISSFLSADGLGVLPDDTLGDALTRLAGVNFIPGGEASASSVSIRGMEGKLNSVQINGV